MTQDDTVMWKPGQPIPLESQYHYYMLLSFVICALLALLVVVVIPRILRRYRPGTPPRRKVRTDRPDPWVEAGRRVKGDPATPGDNPTNKPEDNP